MATIGEPVRLLAEENRLETFYIEGDKSSQCAIITTGGRHVHLYDMRESQPQNSWTIMSGHQLTQGAVLDPLSNRYVAVVDHQVIRLWSKEESSINKSKKITLSQQVFRLLRQSQFQPLIVYADGSMAWLNSATEWLTSPWVPGGDRLMWAEATVVKDELVVVAITKPKEEDASPKAMVFSLKADTTSVQGRQLEMTDKRVSPACLCLRSNGTKASMLSLDASGRLTETWLTGPSLGQTVTLHTVPLQGPRHSLCSLGPGHVGVYGARAPNDTVCLGIWDTKFGILQAWKPLPVTSGKEEVRLYRQGNHLVVACAKGVYAYSFACRSSTLGAALGKFSSTCAEVSNEAALGDIPDILKKLSDPDMTKTQKQFSQAFNSLIQELDKDKTFDTLTIQHQVAAVIKRVLAEKKFWPQEEVHHLIKRSLVPSSMITELVEALTSRDELLLVQSCMAGLRDVPEPTIAHCLGYVLRTEESKFDKMEGASTKKKLDSCPFGHQKEAFVRLLLGLPFNDVFLAGKLKNIDFQNCLQLLQYLHFVLDKSSKNKKGSLSLIKVVDWTSLLLDAHFAQMVLSAEARSVLVNLHQTVEEQVQFCNELVGLESILAQIKEKCALPEKQYPGLYNIHVLHVY